MRRVLILLAAVVLAVAVYELVLRDEVVVATLVPTQATAAIGSGEDAVGVAADGTLLTWQPAPEEGSVPQLPDSVPPDAERLKGPMLEQARVLGATPPALRPYVQGSYYGDSGVNVRLELGAELRFGSDAQAARKWRAAAALLASPDVTAFDYVDLNAPGRPSIWGSGHTLPSLP
jgi:hypothetical protein